ncbi:MAG: hypothetical protein IPG88_16510 [Gemmatimonadetes bacterium]|nr:hypothetical protein [Gemmatimonadota bacterium]
MSTLIDKLREYDSAMASALESAMKPELERIITGRLTHGRSAENNRPSPS